MELPLFPLHTVLSPGLALPLHIFEERYRLLTKRCLDENAPFGVVLIRKGREAGGGVERISAVGTMAEIRQAMRYADGRYDLVVVGTTRFRVDRVQAGLEPYLVGEVTTLREPTGDSDRAMWLAGIVTRHFIRYVERYHEAISSGSGAVQIEIDVEEEGDNPDDGPADATVVETRRTEDDATSRLMRVARRVAAPDDPVALSHVLSGIVQVDVGQRQDLLEARTAEQRLMILDAILRLELEMLGRGLKPHVVDSKELVKQRN